MIEDFDEYVAVNNIADDELGAAFGAWMNQLSGWDGDQNEIVEEP